MRESLSHLDRNVIERGEDGGAWQFNRLRVIASWGEGWDHVSVSLPNRLPTWDEMHWIKTLFWDDEECVIQYHHPKSKYVNNHRYCLHMWKPQSVTLPQPPSIFVGLASAGTIF